VYSNRAVVVVVRRVRSNDETMMVMQLEPNDSSGATKPTLYSIIVQSWGIFFHLGSYP
jgi:hypothetical protein